MPKLLLDFPDLTYLIIGNGPEKINLESKIDNLDLNDKVKILTDVSDEELSGYYASSDIFVMPVENLEDDAEGFGIVYLEAAEFGLPVIGGKSGGATEAILDNETGLLVEPGNQKDLLEKISLFLNNGQLAKKFGAAGKMRIDQEFIWEKQADKLISKLNHYDSRK